MPILIQMLWLMILTLLTAREQLRFNARPRPAIVHLPPNQGLFGLLSLVGIPSLVATTLFFPSWSLLYTTSPELLLPTGWSLLLGLGVTAIAGAILWSNYRWSKLWWERSKLAGLMPTLLWTLATGALLLLYPERFMQLGTYNEFWSQRAGQLVEHPYFWVQTVLNVGTTLGLLALWKRLQVQATR